MKTGRQLATRGERERLCKLRDRWSEQFRIASAWVKMPFLMKLAETLALYRNELAQAASDSPFIVFLCGPALSGTDAPAKLRRAIKERLEKEKFEVVLGEDDGLDNPAIHEIGINAQDNELAFISSHCNAIVIVASSVGSFCELALFSWHFVHPDGDIDSRDTDCIVLISSEYESHKSYLNSGPAAAVRSVGKVEFVDFNSYNCDTLVQRLRDRRGFTTVDNKRGRPRKPPK